MKKLHILVIVMLMSICTFATPFTSQKRLVVEGKFLHAKKVTYDLYVITEDSSFKLLSTHTSTKYFNVEVISGATYMMRFTAEQGDSTITKYLLINPVKKDDFVLEVDFSTEASAELYWHEGAKTYMIRVYEPDCVRLCTTGVVRR